MTTKRLAVVMVLCLSLPACQKPKAKFQPGDKVRVKSTHSEGKVCLRTRLFRENVYWVTVPGSYYVLFPVRERERRAAMDAHYGLTGYPKPWHDEGPFYESELELAR
jgi:hypothetical protein